MKFLRKLIAILVVLAMLGVGILFALQNKAPVPLDLLVYTFEPRSMALWVLLAFALGGILGMAASSLIIVRTRATLNARNRQLDRARDEVGKLRGDVPAAGA
ncbi:MAG: LapA family protein [Halioglobus sp.]|nr:LapA family protein [Halioglobus sp.]